MLHGTGGREYIIGWIDAQILAEGLPAVVSVFIFVYCFVVLVFIFVEVVFCSMTFAIGCRFHI